MKSEGGHFAIEATGTGNSSPYTLTSPTPDIDATAYYWLKHNIRTATSLRPGDAVACAPFRALRARRAARRSCLRSPAERLARPRPRPPGSNRGCASTARSARRRVSAAKRRRQDPRGPSIIGLRARYARPAPPMNESRHESETRCWRLLVTGARTAAGGHTTARTEARNSWRSTTLTRSARVPTT